MKARKVYEFTEEKFLQQFVANFKMNCNAFLLNPTVDTYVETIENHIIMAELLFQMHFISEDTWLKCRELYLDISERAQDLFNDLEIKPRLQRTEQEKAMKNAKKIETDIN